MSSTSTAETPVREWPLKQQKEFLASLKDMGNTEKIIGLGEYLHAKMGIPLPTARQTFQYATAYDANGNDSGPKHEHTRHAPDSIVELGYKVITANRDSQFSRLSKTSNFIEGEYTLTIHGVSINVAMGEETKVDYHPVTRQQIISVVAKAQNIKGRVRTVDPRVNLEEYLWLWMHPRNFDSPARLSPDDQARHGLSINMIAKYYRPHEPARLRSNATYKAEHTNAMDNADNMRIIAEIDQKTEKELRKLSILTNIKMSLDPTLPEEKQYKSHLYAILNDRSGSLIARGLREKLLAAMNRGDEMTTEIVRKAVKADVLVLDGVEIFIKDSDGNMTQPAMLNRFFVPEAALSIWEQWFATELTEQKAIDLVNIIDRVTTVAINELGKLSDGRHVDEEKMRAIDKAIADGLVVASAKPNNWIVKRTGTTICSWSGVNEAQKKASLLKLASSVSLATLLLELDLVRDEE